MPGREHARPAQPILPVVAYATAGFVRSEGAVRARRVWFGVLVAGVILALSYLTWTDPTLLVALLIVAGATLLAELAVYHLFDEIEDTVRRRIEQAQTQPHPDYAPKPKPVGPRRAA